jgi:hypothetical protein
MFLGITERPMRKIGHLTAIYEPIVSTKLDPQRYTTLQTSTACYGLALLLFFNKKFWEELISYFA